METKKIKSIENLLVVDDDKSLCYVIEHFFEDKKYNVTVINNGSDAMSYLEKERPDLVFLDIGLPDISGLDVLKRIKEIDTAIKVIIITGYEADEKMVLLKSLNPDAFIHKPFSLEDLEKELLKLQNG